ADDAVGLEAAGNAALFRGDHKLVRNMPPHGAGKWYLYNIAVDPGETNDLSEEMPGLLAELRAEYDANAERVGVLEMPDGYAQMRQLTLNLVEEHKTAIILSGVAALALLGGLIWLCWLGARRLRAR